MKKLLIIIPVFLGLILSAQVNFNDYFIDKSLRFDYTIGGNSKETKAYFNKLKQEPFWGGSKKNLIDKFNFGDFRVSVLDSAGEKLL
ncbi:MAG: peptidase M64, partial [Bacteroidales bacterium]|nr:peptidase M64 [Bacteroidales bacterium]